MTPRDDLNLELIAERLASLTKITELQFASLKNDLEDMKSIPERVSKLETRFGDGMRRLEALEAGGVRRSEWGRKDLPMILITIALVAVGLAQMLGSVLH